MGLHLETTEPRHRGALRHDAHSVTRATHVLRTSVLAGVAYACTASAGAAAGSRGLAEVYADVKPSVVYVVCALRDGAGSGSGFIYASDETTSYVITANHVVEGASKIDVILDSDPTHRYAATVVKHDHARDVAELAIPIGRRVALKLDAPGNVREGMSIAAIGYPRAVKKFEELMGDHLRPSVHSGIVSAVRLGGDLVQFDAETDHGDSGGPVIDARSGRVVGVVRGSLLDQSYANAALETLPGSNFAASSTVIAGVFGDEHIASKTGETSKSKAADAGMASAKLAVDSAHTAVAAATAGMAAANSGLVSADATMATAKAALASAGASSLPAGAASSVMASSAEYRIGLAAPHYDDPNVDALAALLTARVGTRFTHARQVYVVPVTSDLSEASNAKVAGYCDDTRLNAIVAPHVRLHAVEAGADRSAAGRKAFATLELKVTDCSGNPFFVGHATTPKAIAFATSSQDRAVIATFGAMQDRLLAEFDRFAAAHTGAWTSLLKTGIAVDPLDERYQSMIGFEQAKDSRDYTVTTVYGGGPAAAAGVVEGDTIVAIDGHAARGVSRAALLPLLNVASYDMSVQRPGGVVVLHVQPKKYADLLTALKR